MSKKIPADFSFETNTKINLAESRLLEAKYHVNKKKHRNTIENCDHWFIILTHPLLLCIALFVFFIIYLIIKYVAIQTNIPWLIAFRNDLEVGISYIFTIIVTYIITSFIENYKSIQSKH